MIKRPYTRKEDFLQENDALQTALPYDDDLGIFAVPLTVGQKTIPNRLACQAMEGCDGTETGSPGELTIRRYDRFAKGGAGLIWFEATAVCREGRANPRQLWITAENVDDFKREVARIKETGEKANGTAPVVIMQATHSGRYSKPDGVPAPLIAYNNPIFEADSPIPGDRILSDDDLDRVRDALVNAAELAEKAGFDGVDIKCCHRYLNSELLSAHTRPGRYGGSFENRTRLLREAVKGALERCSSGFLVSTRLNVYDGFPYPYGFGVKSDGTLDFDPAEPDRLIKELSSYGVRLFNITMGNPYFNPHVNRPFTKGPYVPPEDPLIGVARVQNGTAELKKRNPDAAILCSALSYLGTEAPHVAASFIRSGGYDLAGFGRTAFAYPDFANDILFHGGMDAKKICLCCSKCTEIMRKPGGTPGCVIRDQDPYLAIYRALCMK
ncbi:MAG: flavin oxidoreductase/NADH oxidase [Lachnospiraceae bacterium]|nr:flavin oxidoreductase/NADH oxidase [Lachnospiraceae bacterium]